MVSSIYHSALTQDPIALKKALITHCIDESEDGKWRFSAGTRLASENNQAACRWLLERGANINYMVLGAALSGHFEFAGQLIEEGASYSYAISGAAMSNHHAYLNNLFNACNPLKDKSTTHLAMGAGLGGHRQLLENHISSNFGISSYFDRCWAAHGLATGGHFELLREFLKQNNNSAFIGEAIYGAGAGGFRDLISELKSHTRSLEIDNAGGGAASGNQVTLALDFLSQGANKDNLARSAAIGGHKILVEEILKQGGDINSAAEGAAWGGHKEYAEELVKRGAHRERLQCGVICGSHDFLLSEWDFQGIITTPNYPVLQSYYPDIRNRVANAKVLKQAPFLLSSEEVIYLVSKKQFSTFVLLASFAVYQKENFQTGKFRNTGLPYDIWMNVFGFLTGLTRSVDKSADEDRLILLGGFFRAVIKNNHRTVATQTDIIPAKVKMSRCCTVS